MIEHRWAIWISVTITCITAGALVARLPGSLPTPTGTATWLAAIGLGVIAWLTLRRRSMVALILIYGFLTFGAAAAALYRPTTRDFQDANARVAYLAQQTPGYRYLLVFLAAAFSIWVASLAIAVLFPAQQERFSLSVGIKLSPRMLAFAGLPLAVGVYGIGIHTLFNSSRYLEHTGPNVAVIFGQALGPIGVLICGYFTFHREQQMITRIFALTLALAYEALYLATATRLFALWFLLMFAGGMLTGTWDIRRQRIGLLVTLVVAILALEIPLGLRDLPDHGLNPAIGYLVHQPSLVFSSQDPINNLLFGAPLTLYVAYHVGHLPFSDVITAVSPAPSQLNNWSQLSQSLRLNAHTPYGALGELLNHGWVFLMVVMAGFGAGFTIIERIALNRSDIIGGLSRMAVFGAAALFMIESTEYPLRSVTRLSYYAFGAVVVMALIPSLSRARARQTVSTAGDVSPAPDDLVHAL
jgi:hypothetical protein